MVRQVSRPDCSCGGKMGCGSVSKTVVYPSGHWSSNKDNVPKKNDIISDTKTDYSNRLGSPKQAMEPSVFSKQLQNYNKHLMGPKERAVADSNGLNFGTSQKTGLELAVRQTYIDRSKMDDGGVWVGIESHKKPPDKKRNAGLLELQSQPKLEVLNSSDIDDNKYKDNLRSPEDRGIIPKECHRLPSPLCTDLADLDMIKNPLRNCETPKTDSDLQKSSANHQKATSTKENAQSVLASKDYRHARFQQNHHQFESLENEASHNPVFFCDDDKQMSDSELDDHVTLFPLESPGNSEQETDSGLQKSMEEHDTETNVRKVMLPSSAPHAAVVAGIDTGNNTVEPENGVSLTDSVYSPESKVHLKDLSTRLESPCVPQFLYRWVTFIEQGDLKTEGLYRIPGNRSMVDRVFKEGLDNKELDLSDSMSPYVVATCVKTFVNQLSEPLVPTFACQELLQVKESTPPQELLPKFRDVLQKLPNKNYEILKYVVSHLSKVAEYQDYNNMNSKNLAICWWPTIMRLNFDTYEGLVQGSRAPEEIVQLMIEESSSLFTEESQA